MNDATPRIDFLLRRLVLLAGNVRDTLTGGEWEDATIAREEFDEQFAKLQRLVETGHVFDQRHANQLQQLRHVHGENEQLTARMLAKAGGELGSVSKVRQISSAYAPLSTSGGRQARFVDGSA